MFKLIGRIDFKKGLYVKTSVDGKALWYFDLEHEEVKKQNRYDPRCYRGVNRTL